jgi:hypothetical protein
MALAPVAGSATSVHPSLIQENGCLGQLKTGANPDEREANVNITFDICGYEVLVSEHGYFCVFSPRLPYDRFEDLPGNLYRGSACELGHGIHYRRDELAAYSDDEIERAIARGEPSSEPWSDLDILLSTLGDDLNVALDDRIVELAAREWVMTNRELLALREGLSPGSIGDDPATPGPSSSGVLAADLTA